MNIVVYNIAKHSVIILFFISNILLWNKNNLFCYYLIGISVSFLVNSLLRNTIKQKRPNYKEDENNNENENDVDKETVIKDKNNLLNNSLKKYGMPSGHAQHTIFSSIFIALSLQNIFISSIFFIISFIAIFQRVHFYFHTVEQVIIGGIIGSLVSYLFYNLSTKKYFTSICKQKLLLLLISIIIIRKL